MLAYAANRRTQRRLSPSSLGLIVAGHALAIGLLITAKMDVSIIPKAPPTRVFDVAPPPPPPEPVPPPPKSEVQPREQLPPPPDSFVEQPPSVLPLPPQGPTFEVGPSASEMVPDIGKALETPLPPLPKADPLPVPPVRIAARAVTPADLLRPPYPDSKRRSEEEAVLRLRLAIDARGRVTAVEPVGAADPDFLAAARGHLLRYWRYRPATEDGKPVASSMVITLRFELED